MKQLIYISILFFIFGCGALKKATLHNRQTSDQHTTKFIYTDNSPNIDDSNYKNNFTINHSSKMYYGFDGSNLFYGEFNLIGKNKIYFKPIDSIKIENNSHNNWSNSLKETKKYNLKENHFSLNNKKDGKIKYQIYPYHSSTILEKHWRLEYLSKNKLPDLDREIYFIIKNGTNTISGYNGCNNFFGSYEIDEENNKISFINIGQTKKACLNIKISEKDINNIFINTNSFINIDGYLILLDINHKILAVFAAIYF